jgi:hypothetical protein
VLRCALRRALRASAGRRLTAPSLRVSSSSAMRAIGDGDGDGGVAAMLAYSRAASVACEHLLRVSLRVSFIGAVPHTGEVAAGRRRAVLVILH